LHGKREELDLLRAQADELSKNTYWPADVDCLTAQLNALDTQCTSLDTEVCDAQYLPLVVCKCCVSSVEYDGLQECM